ncbi:MAG: hypothetical protein ACRCTZ_13720 [Sarcina sp.]
MKDLCFLEFRFWGATSIHIAFLSNNRLYLSEDFHLYEAIIKKGILFTRCDAERTIDILTGNNYRKISFEEFKTRFDIKSFYYELNNPNTSFVQDHIYFRTLKLSIIKNK